MDYPNLSVEIPGVIPLPGDRLIPINREKNSLTDESGTLILVEPRNSINSELAGKAYFLNATFDWVIGKDSAGVLCLVPLRKV